MLDVHADPLAESDGREISLVGAIGALRTGAAIHIVVG
jgi:hypothetical protein